LASLEVEDTIGLQPMEFQVRPNMTAARPRYQPMELQLQPNENDRAPDTIALQPMEFQF